MPGPQEMSPPVSWLMGACPLGEAGGEAPRDTSSHPRPWALCLLDHPWFLWPQQSSQFGLCVPGLGQMGAKLGPSASRGRLVQALLPTPCVPCPVPLPPGKEPLPLWVPMGSVLSEGTPHQLLSALPQTLGKEPAPKPSCPLSGLGVAVVPGGWFRVGCEDPYVPARSLAVFSRGLQPLLGLTARP